MTRVPAILLAAAAVAFAAGCSSSSSAAPAAATFPSAAPATSRPAACPDARSTVAIIASEGGIDLTTGSMTASITSGQASGWASSLGTVVKEAASGQLAADLLHAEAEATDLSLVPSDSTASAFVAALQKADADCAQ